MKRRDFTKGLAAAGLAPALPLPSVAAVSTGATAGTANFTPFMYSWSVTHARGLGQCSTEMLVSKLGIKVETAAAICSRMVKQGIITAPNALGVSRALAPKAPVRSVRSTRTAPETLDVSERMKTIEEDVLDVLDQEEEQVSEDVATDNTSEALEQ